VAGKEADLWVYAGGATEDLLLDPEEWMWVHDSKEVPLFSYTAKLGYTLQLASQKRCARACAVWEARGLRADGWTRVWKRVWWREYSRKMASFSWLLVHLALSTSDYLHQRRLGERWCVCCEGGAAETWEHCLWTCKGASVI